MPLSEGSFTIDHSKVFIPFDPATDSMQQRSKGSLLVEIQPFLVETSRDLILLDAGLGFSKHGVLQLFDRIEGDQPAILGLPLLPLLGFLRQHGVLLR